MKIVHICLGNPFTEEMAYKENYIVKANLEDGNDVMIIAPALKWEKNQIVDTEEGQTIIYGGVRLIRYKYDQVICRQISEKIRKVSRVMDLLKEYNPDVVVYQCVQGYSINFAKELKKYNPNIKIYGDVSTSYQNSARNFISKNILHKGIYKKWLKKAERYFDKIFYVIPESREFLTQVYGINEDKLEFNPLCSQITSYEKKQRARQNICQRHGFSGQEILFLHAGKMDKRKKSVEVLDTFFKIKNFNIRLIIAGSFYDDIKEQAERIIAADDRIVYLGFLTAEELEEYLDAANVYVQPGSPSQTANNAICSFTPVILANIPTYRCLIDSNGWLINDVSELEKIFLSIIHDPHQLASMEKAAEKVAREKLDYRRLAARLYE